MNYEKFKRSDRPDRFPGFDINFLTNLSIRASANLFYLPETVNY